MICSMATCPGMPCCFPSRCISFRSRLEPQVKKASALPAAISSSRIRSTFSTALVPSESSTVMVCAPNAAPQHRDVLPRGLELEANAQGACEVELVTRLQRRHALSAAAFTLVEELDLACRLVDPVDAHRPAHPDLGAVG